MASTIRGDDDFDSSNTTTQLRLGTQTAKSYTSDTGSHTWYYTDAGQMMTGYYALWAWGDDMIGGMRQRPLQYYNGSAWVTVSEV